MLSLPNTERAYFQKIIRDDISYPLKFSNIEEAFKDFKTCLSETVITNLDLLDEVPLHTDFQVEELKEYLKSEIESDLTKDPLFEKSVEIGRYAENMFKSIESYFREIFGFHEALVRKLHSGIFSVSKMFLNSNLPLPFVKAISDSLLAEMDYVDVFDKEIRKERLDLIVHRNNRRKFERICDLHNLWVTHFVQRRSRMEHDRIKLIWYVDFNNSASVKEVFKDKFFKLSSLDKPVLYSFIRGLQEQVQEMEKLNSTKMEWLAFLPYEIDNGTRTIVKMMQLLDQHEGTI